MTTAAPKLVPEFTLDIDAGDERDLPFEFASTVDATELLDLSGSLFTLRFANPAGEELLAIEASPIDGLVGFAISRDQRALLTAGRNGRFMLERTIDGRTEVWGRGNTNVTGGTYG